MLAVPFVPQAQDHDCGPAALASVLRYYGQDASLADLTENLYLAALRRTLMPDMENYARALGFQTVSGSGNAAMLIDRIDSGQPIIILLETGFGVIKRPHYIVLWGYTQDGFLAHTGIREGVLIAYDQLDKRWQPMNRLFLVIN